MPKTTLKKPQYTKMNPIEHILTRPDMYLGGIQIKKMNEYIAEDGFNIVQNEIKCSPALLRIFIEALSNAIDNVARSSKTKTPCTKIKVNVDIETGETSVWNDGKAIDIEINEEEKCYNHTMIFGQLLTSSNYDDDEDREDISGRNGIGIKTCLGLGTKIPLWDGRILNVEDLKVGDVVIGDDGNKRNIKDITTGSGKLYKVSQSRGDDYIVNEYHILTVRMPDHKVVFWNNTKKGWSMRWLDKEKKSIRMTSIRTYTPSIDKAREEIEQFRDTIQDDNTMDISIKKYMKLTKNARSRLTGFSGDNVNWDKKDVIIDPYVLGLLLGDEFAINSDDDPEILEYLEKWGKQLKNNKISYSISSASSKYKAPLRKLLSEYNLVNNKHIPKEYLINSREIRLAVLAGIIDSDGHCSTDRNGRRVTIAQGMNHEQLAYDIVYLSRSLGFMCNYTIKKTQWTYKGELKRGKAVNINISGEGLGDIPTKVLRKKCNSPLKRKVTNTGKLLIEPVNDGDFVGISLDGNKRFVLNDFTVTHNCNVFSKSFKVFGYDPKTKQTFEQTWTNNMKTVGQPKIKKNNVYTKGFTHVTWTPDFARLGIAKYSKDIINYYCRYVIDTAMLAKVKVYFNNELIPVKNIEEYAQLYMRVPTKEILIIKTNKAEIAITPSNGEYQAISFANGVHTSNGGTHVDAWSEAIFRPIVNKFNKPKKPQINIKDVKQFFRIFVVVSVAKPTFDSQDKSRLESPAVVASVKSSHIATIMKWSVVDKIEDIVRSKEMSVLKKTERKRTGFTKIEGLDPANNEGTKYSNDCTLILCEGLSAKTYAVQGIDVGVFGKEGRDWFGIYPLRGKVLNVRNNKATTIAKNAVVSDLIKIMGLKYGVDYTIDKNFKTLRYGKIMILTDSDSDGIHISGLIQNLLHNLFPTLLYRKDAFVVSMYTPIVRVYLSGKKSLLFYDEDEYHRYVSKYTKKFPNKLIKKKYYKGLGTSNEEDIMETFGVKMLRLHGDENLTDNMNKIFHKNHADARKDWLSDYNIESGLSWSGHKEEELDMYISDFLNTEVIKFSISDCKRSIPNVIDGLKESHRKVLFSCFKRNLRHSGKTLKVAQLAGYVAEHSGYHHGEQNMFETITKMAHEFPGSNNIPLLYRDGQFGSRLQGGKDAANARYIFTKLDRLTRMLFNEKDDPLLDPVEDDGDIVEPKQYVPILPMILVNGCTAGIGTGWSCSVPCYNPLDIITSIKTWLDKDGKVLTYDGDMAISLLPEMKPWYRGFTGTIEKDQDNRYKTVGCIEEDKKKKVVTELPIGLWTDKFKDILESYVEDKQIHKVKNYSNPKTVKFVIEESKDGFICNENTLKLHSYLYTSNMVMFDEDGKLRKFKNTDEILDYFCTVRFKYYVKRKKYIINNYEYELKYLSNKKRFLEEVMSGDLSLYEGTSSRDEDDIVQDLEDRKYDKQIIKPKDDDDEDQIGGYNYLLRMQIRSFTTKKLNSLIDDIDSLKKKIDKANNTSEKQMWIIDLDEFVKLYTVWLKDIANEKVKIRKKK